MRDPDDDEKMSPEDLVMLKTLLRQFCGLVCPEKEIKCCNEKCLTRSLKERIDSALKQS